MNTKLAWGLNIGGFASECEHLIGPSTHAPQRPSYTNAIGDGPRNFEPWSSHEDITSTGTPSPNYHTNGRTFEASTDLTCIAPLHDRSSVVLGSNSCHASPEFVTLTTRLPQPLSVL
ncbi:hypothetical protein TNCV_3910671 [Trichonephila clavipes]|nr:hypothetical protein TNCV_3910671 [Trichonephila clavipes]